MVSTSELTQSTKNSAANSAHNDNSSSSYFKKTVCLKNWWLMKAEDDFEGKLAIAGLASGEKQAMRVFSSAPILKRYDLFTLETVDGVFVLIKGFINKVRTKENGFPSEVFKHFVIGFPPYWEEYAEKCFGEGFCNKDIPRNTLDHGVDNFIEGTSNRNKADVSEERHGNIDTMDLSSEDLANTVSAKGQNQLQQNACTKFLVEDANSSQVVSETIICGASKGFDSPNHVNDLNGGEAKFHVDIDSDVLRSCKTKGISKSNGKGKKRAGRQSESKGSENFSILDDSVNLDDASIKSPHKESLQTGSVVEIAKTLETSKKNRDDAMNSPDESLRIVSGSTPSNFDHRGTQTESLPRGSIVETAKTLKISKKNRDDTMNCPKPLLSSEDNSAATPNMDTTINSTTTNSTRRLSSMLKNLSSHSNRNSSLVLEAHEDPDEERLNYTSAVGTARSVGNSDILKEFSRSKGKMDDRGLNNSKSKLKDDQTIANLLVNEKNRCNSDQLKRGAVDGETESGGTGVFFPSGIGIQPREDETEQMCGNITSQADKQSKKMNKALRSSVGLADMHQKKEANAKKTSRSRNKTKKKLTYESPVTLEGTDKTSIVSPESLCFKRSRSGRLLLPTLEFWRNQMAIYDANHLEGVDLNLKESEGNSHECLELLLAEFPFPMTGKYTNLDCPCGQLRAMQNWLPFRWFCCLWIIGFVLAAVWSLSGAAVAAFSAGVSVDFESILLNFLKLAE
ncbi:hypothetical protein U1Q18_013073 [Sarracenia purpurea var. burkii]